MGELYETDALEWSEQQAALLRRLAAGEAVNAAVDWENVAEEIEAMGRAELNSFTSLLGQAILHMLKLSAEPDSQAADHWWGEVAMFLSQAQDAFTPSMRQRTDLHRIYARQQQQQRLDRLRVKDHRPIPPTPDTCPYTLDELLDENADRAELVARLDA